MFHTLYILIIVLPFFNLATARAAELDGTDSLAYIEMAEDILVGVRNEKAIDVAKKCYVLAAFFDAQLHRSAMLGLIEIETDQHKLDALLSSLPSAKLFLGNVVYHLDTVRPVATPNLILDACKQVQNLRMLDTIHVAERNDAQEELLQYAAASMPEELSKVLLQGGKVPSAQSVSVDSLKAELLLLGGTTQWSAAVLVEGNIPLGVKGSIDLAALMGINTSNYMFKNGRWHTP
jgi:hypothetical protein